AVAFRIMAIGPGDGAPLRRPGSSERNIVVEAVVVRRRLRSGLLLTWRRLACGLLLGVRLARSSIAAAAEQLHGAAHIHHDLGGVAVLALLILPLAGLQAAFEVALRPLAEVLGGDLGDLAEQHHTVPLGALLQLAGR